jgi:hypothetical protein
MRTTNPHILQSDIHFPMKGKKAMVVLNVMVLAAPGGL